MNPKVSVVMAVYNGAAFVREAIDSILHQTFSDFEFIIIDDGSSDDTPDVLQDYARADARVILLRNEHNLGLTRSLNRALHTTRGDYIARQDADDISLPARLETEVAVLESRPDVILVSGNLEYRDESGRWLGRTQLEDDPRVIAWKLLFYNHVAAHSLVMFRRTPVMASGGYAEEYRYSQDYELWVRLAQEGLIVILPDILLQQRVHSTSITVQNTQDQERLSLTCSSRALSDLLARPLSMADIVALREFWMERAIPATGSFPWLNDQLEQLYRAFLRTYPFRGTDAETLEKKLRLAVAGRYTHWAIRVSEQCRPLFAARLRLYALLWSSPDASWATRTREVMRQLWLMRRCLVRLIPRPIRRMIKWCVAQR